MVSFLNGKGNIFSLRFKYNLIDPIANNYETENEPNVFILRSKRIDFLFCSKFILQFITAYGITPFGHIVSADHHGTFINIKLAQYIRNQFIDTFTNKSRLLQSNHPKKINQYKEKLLRFTTKNI